MFKSYVYLCLFIGLPLCLTASNLKMEGGVVEVNENIAVAEVTLSWDN